MREPERIDRILSKIRDTWKKHSDMRFGQLLINMGLVPDEYVTWSQEDDITEEIVDKNPLN